MSSNKSYDTENSALISGINDILQHIQIENSYFNLTIFYNITDFTVFF